MSLPRLIFIFGACCCLNVKSETGDFKSPKVRYTLYNNDSQVEHFEVVEDATVNVTFFLEGDLRRKYSYIVFNESSTDRWIHFEVTPHTIPLFGPGEEDIILQGTSALEIYSGTIGLKGSFIGFSNLHLYLVDSQSQFTLIKSSEVKILKSPNVLETIFIVLIVLMLFVAYINMGCALNISKIKTILQHPIAPCIGLFSQYFIMPLTSYGIGYLLFYSQPELWLGLFLTGCSPGGGGSNLWTYLLEGDLDLSVTMTMVSTVTAFLSFPFWVFLLGVTIPLYSGTLSFPYANIAGLIISLSVPLGIGLLIQLKFPKAAVFFKKLLKPTGFVFITFALVVGSWTNYYIFFFFTWKVLIAGIALPWLGFLFGGLLALLTKRGLNEIIAISVETGIQNTGIAIGVLKVALTSEVPLGDIALVVPIAAATMTPLPLITTYIIKKFFIKKKSLPSNLQPTNTTSNYSSTNQQSHELNNLPNEVNLESAHKRNQSHE